MDATSDEWLDMGTVALPPIADLFSAPTANAMNRPMLTNSVDVNALAAAVLALMKHELRIERERLG